jgi:uncharacterized spore protein YtfJ
MVSETAARLRAADDCVGSALGVLYGIAISREGPMFEPDDVRAAVQKQLDRLAKTRDELRVQAQLAKTETRGELNRLEAVWQRVQDELRRVGDQSQGPVQDLGNAAGVLLDELKHGYERVKRELAEVNLSKVLAEAEAAAVVPFARTLEGLAGQIGAHADARAVYGTPVTHAGYTVVPVARVMAGFGLGARHNAGNSTEPAALDGTGIGGGGGYSAVPVGFIEIGPDGARFQRLEHPVDSWSGAAELGLRLARRGLSLLAASRRKG